MHHLNFQILVAYGFFLFETIKGVGEFVKFIIDIFFFLNFFCFFSSLIISFFLAFITFTHIIVH